MALSSAKIAVPSSSSAAVLPRISSLRSTTLPLRTLSFAGSHRPFLALRNSKSIARVSSIRCSSSALTPQLKATLDKVVTSNKVVLFMKGTKDFPQCGFSNTVVQILTSLNVPFETINILENEMLRQGLKEYSSWPTFPQLYIEGEFFGGCDITVESDTNGSLA